MAGLTPLPGALKNAKPDPVHADIVFNLDEPDMEVFSKFHEKLQDAIKRSHEWADATGSKHSEKPSSGFEDMDDDIPF